MSKNKSHRIVSEGMIEGHIKGTREKRRRSVLGGFIRRFHPSNQEPARLRNHPPLPDSLPPSLPPSLPTLCDEARRSSLTAVRTLGSATKRAESSTTAV